MRWWGWGRPDHGSVLPEQAVGWLRARIGVSGRPRPPVALSQVELPKSGLAAGPQAALETVLGAAGVCVDHDQRVLHAAGKGYPDLVRLRSGRPEEAPDAVLYPRSEAQLQATLAACAEQDIAMVPFGGGTSVVGGVAPMRGEHRAVATIDLRHLRALTGVDRISGLVSCAAGRRVADLEDELGRRGLTLGHFPQSYEYVSIGGCAATRSAGQASGGYGRFEDLVHGLRCLTPSGELDLAAMPASAAGPDLRELIVGSEGTLGVISELALRVRPVPAQRVYEGFMFETFAGGSEALRLMVARGLSPDVARLSDAAETQMTMLLAGRDAVKDRLARAYLGLRGYRQGCLAVIGFEGDLQSVAYRRRHALEHFRRAGALSLGREVGEAWAAARFAGPYLRDELLTHGVMVETLETATRWSRLGALQRAVSTAIEQALLQRGTPGLVMCHISHVYATGASLYFTYLAAQELGHELEQWQAVKRAASEAIVAARATITHHHAVGRDHAPWLPREVGPRGVATLRAVKAELDPDNLMNPGKLLAG